MKDLCSVQHDTDYPLTFLEAIRKMRKGKSAVSDAFPNEPYIIKYDIIWDSEEKLVLLKVYEYEAKWRIV